MLPSRRACILHKSSPGNRLLVSGKLGAAFHQCDIYPWSCACQGGQWQTSIMFYFLVQNRIRPFSVKYIIKSTWSPCSTLTLECTSSLAWAHCPRMLAIRHSQNTTHPSLPDCQHRPIDRTAFRGLPHRVQRPPETLIASVNLLAEEPLVNEGYYTMNSTPVPSWHAHLQRRAQFLACWVPHRRRTTSPV